MITSLMGQNDSKKEQKAGEHICGKWLDEACSFRFSCFHNQLPAFQYLIEHGQYYKNLVSSFPTMSVTIDSSLLTGKYPDEHRIPGLTWYSSDEKKVINYGTGPMEVLRQSVDPVVTDGA